MSGQRSWSMAVVSDPTLPLPQCLRPTAARPAESRLASAVVTVTAATDEEALAVLESIRFDSV